MLRNLLSNSDKYSPREAPIEVVGSAVEGEVVIRVLDQGSGLSPEDAERVFDPFYRAEATAKKARGLGIGLTACKRLVDAQSGRIWVQARTGGGLEVGFALPVYTFQERRP